MEVLQVEHQSRCLSLSGRNLMRTMSSLKSHPLEQSKYQIDFTYSNIYYTNDDVLYFREKVVRHPEITTSRSHPLLPLTLVSLQFYS